MIVPDASVIIEVLLRTPRGVVASPRLLRHRGGLHAPHLLTIEVAHVVRRCRLRGEITESRAKEALADLRDLPIDYYPHSPLLSRIWELHENLSAYDAAYATLAEVIGAELWTCDERLARAPSVRARVSVLR